MLRTKSSCKKGGTGMRIAVDAMGGDNAPKEIIEGAVEAAGAEKIHILLVGDSEKIQKYMGGTPPKNIAIHHCTETIGMEEQPAAAIRRKKD
ncbi:MAG: hypothetical protein GX318_07170, partial [Clostridia bacterium]|nr:hypothetical protein [Clostridia bacterium]